MTTEADKITVGEQIRNLRGIRGLSQEALAASAGIRQATVCDIETGKSDPQLSTLLAIADSLGIRAEVLLKNSTISGGE